MLYRTSHSMMIRKWAEPLVFSCMIYSAKDLIHFVNYTSVIPYKWPRL